MSRHKRRHETQTGKIAHQNLQGFDSPQTRDGLLSVARAARRGALLNHFNSFLEPPRVYNPQRSLFSEVEDFRRWRPEKRLRMPSPRQYHLQNGEVALQSRRLATLNRVSGLLPHLRNQFREPRTTIVCVRRQTRRQVLFALQRLGRGSGGAKKTPRWTAQSFIQCRRVR